MKISSLAPRALAAAVLILASLSVSRAQDVTVFECGENGFDTYRIPAIVKAADGSYLAFAEARKFSRSDTGDIDLVLKRSFDGGKTWSAITTIWDDGENVCGNPCPVVLPDGEIILLSTWNRGDDHEKDIQDYKSRDTRRVFMLRSRDNGATWSTPVEITSMVKKPDWGWYATGPCHAAVISSGHHKERIVVPSNHSEHDSEGKVVARSQIVWSDDRGESWHIGAISARGGNESTVCETKGGGLMLNMRNFYKPDTLRMAGFSADGGESWELETIAGDLVEPRCQGTMINLSTGKAGKKLAFCNPRHNVKRRNLTLSISKDNGRTWPEHLCVFEGPAAYSDIVLTGRGKVGVLYENGTDEKLYSRISFKILKL